MTDNLEKDKTVKVAVRQRPMFGNDSDVAIKYEAKASILLVDERPYVFDHILGPTISQEQLFNEIMEPMLEKVSKGFNCTALAYGQTGTGKSYTMGLNNEDDEKHMGIVRRCLFKLAKSTNCYDIFVSFVEIYNEKVFDLLSVNPNEPMMSKGFKYPGGVRKQIFNIYDCNVILKECVEKRHIRPTVMNNESSRSHVIFSIEVSSKDILKPTRAILNLVDLAGSEGVRRTGHIGVAMSEGVYINQGLLCIGKILQAMSEGKKVIPFRDSVLGSVLQDSLNQNSYLTLLACISAKRVDLSETLSTIRFAQRVKQLKLTPQLNSLMTELNKKKAKTPYSVKTNQLTKPLRTPSKRPALENITSNQENRLANTFCTPAKERRLESNFNHTDIGLTPKEKEKAQKFVIPTVPKSYFPPPIARSSTVYSTEPRESLFEHTMESWTLNTSSSTTFEAPINVEKPVSFSPIVAKCMEKFENVLENKMQKFMESFINANTTPAHNRTTNQQTPNTVRSEIRSILREMITEKKESNIQTLSTSPPNLNARCQLFKTSSPVFKIPEIPKLNPTVLEISNDSFNETSIIERTVRAARRSQRHQNRNDSLVSNSSNSIDSSHPQTVRRSLRLQQQPRLEDSLMQHSETGRTRRRSKSVTKFEDSLTQHSENPKRRSIRRRSKSVPFQIPITSQKNEQKSNSKYNSLNNTIISNYFKDNNKIQPNLGRHRTAILKLLNQGTMKELQVLPQVGQKTAYLLVTHRIQIGQFKNLRQIEKLPIWRGNGWERFAKSNMLI